MEEIGNSTGAETERECEEDVASRENLPNSVTVSKIEVEDGRATSEVAFEGGEPDEFEEIALSGGGKVVTKIANQCEDEIEINRTTAKFERELEEEEAEEEAEIEAEEPTEYPRAVQQNFMKSCLATSGSKFATCECSLAALEASYTVKELQQAEANLASGKMREIVESAFAGCA